MVRFRAEALDSSFYFLTFFFSKCLYWLWGPANFIFIGYMQLFPPGLIRLGSEADHSPPSGLEIDGKKVKVTPVQALSLCTGRTARRGSRGIALPFHDHSTRRG